MRVAVAYFHNQDSNSTAAPTLEAAFAFASAVVEAVVVASADGQAVGFRQVARLAQDRDRGRSVKEDRLALDRYR